MGLGDKAEELKGKVKAAVGDATDKPDLEAEGRVQEASADAEQTGDSVTDALRAAGSAVKGEEKRVD